MEKNNLDQMPKLWSDWRLHLTVLVITMISEAIGTRKIPVGPGTIMFLPLLYAMIIGLVLYLMKPIKFIGSKQAKVAESLIVICIMPLIAKTGISSGVALPKVVAAGPALLLQEFGNLGTIFISLPIAMLLGFKRECIGMCHSVGREPNVGLIVDKYGFNSSEARGVMMVYVVGTLIGTIFMGAMASFLATTTPISPVAYAMATGVGSGSMMAAASAPLVELFPDLATDIQAFASISNLISTATGLYMSILIGLPLTNKLYQLLSRWGGKNRKAKQEA